ncbi:hypothetical protein GGX14DRAFT_348582 [Mycena pura]|uniref:Uncharacterized protein n=1 Tax=Mycena pura TaxID=153505 RepID=A0AAD7E2M1_9AGAR|nr:hypothetical protein GGX14DRAFT_348582 [Mycena pura]
MATSSTSTADSDEFCGVTCPPGAPTWFTGALAELVRVGFGPAYRDLVEALVELEQAYGFLDKGQKIALNGRPSQIAAWFKEGRKWKAKPELRINDLDAFAEKWGRWWDAMQPDWRERGEDGKRARVASEGRGWGSTVCCSSSRHSIGGRASKG